MADSKVFPAIIKATYDPSGGFPKMVQDAQNASGRIKKQFESDFGQIANLAKEALAIPRNAGGSLDLNVGQYKEAATAAKANAIALRELANAAEAAQKSSGDNSRATQVYVQAARAAAREAEDQAKSVNATAVAYERLQGELNKVKSATDAVVAQAGRGTTAYQANTQSVRAMRQATTQAGQQLQDIVISMGSGQRASTVLAQQLPQLAFAFSDVGGKVGAVARFLSGPWGVAVAVGAFALGPLIDGLFQTAKSADEVKFATDAMGSAQSILGNVLDITTGKITTQSGALLGLAKAQLLVARVQAQTRAAEARRGVQDIQYRESEFSGGLGGGFSIRRRDRDARDVISEQVLSGTLDSKTAVERLENLRRVGKLTDDQFASAAASVANLGVEMQNLKVYDEAGKLLDGTGGTSLLKPGKTRKTRTKKGDGGAASLAEFGEDAGKKIANISDQFGDAPTLIIRTNKALRELDDIQSDLERRKPEGLSKLLADLSQARSVVANSVSTDFGKQTQAFQDRLNIQRLILQGRIDEAAVAERIAELEERYGTGKRLEVLKEELKAAQEILAAEDSTQEEREKAQATIKANTKEYDTLSALVARIRRETTEQYGLEKAINEAIEKRNDSIARYQNVVSGTYGALEDLLSGGKAGDFFKSIRDQFNQLRGQNLADSLFGDAFRQLKQFTERNNPETQAVQRLVTATDTTSDALKTFTDIIIQQSTRITGAANDNPAGSTTPSTADGIAPEDLIVVTGSIKKAIVDGNRYNFVSFSNQVASSIVVPFLDKLDETFGTKFFGQLSGALTGALSGYARAGKVGGVLGFGQGLFDTLSKNTKISEKSAASLFKISSKFGQGLGGAQTGDQTAQLLRSFGVKTSRTGGQIGGAIGSFLPIPGGEIIGSIIGSVVGGLFKKTKKGSTTISNLTDDLAFTGSGSLRESTLGLGNNVKASLANIIEQLGGTAGSFSVSVGQRGKSFVVDPTGSGRTKGGGVLKFKTEEEAARAALLDAIKDGAVQGIKAGAQRLLQAGKDLDAQLQKAVKFQNVFDRLEAIKNPLGAAVGALNREFTGLISIFKEASASAEDFAALEELYGLERAKIIKEQSESLTNSLRSLIDDLKQGENGLSLRDRLSNIRSQFDPLANDIREGKTVDYDRFTELARQLIDVQRQISGSQVDYFAVFNEILGLSQSALAGQQNVISLGAAASSPFSGTASPSNASTPVVNAIGSQTNTLVASLAAVQAQIANLSFAPSRLNVANGFSVGGSTYF